MEQLLYTNLRSVIALSPEEYAELEKGLLRRVVKKKKFLLHEGSPCDYVAFVEKGCLRSYTIDDTGTEHVVQLAMENHWIGDLYSFLKNRPSLVNIEAIEDTEVLLLENHRLEGLYRTIPTLERYFRILYQNAYLHLQQRLNASLSASAAERYTALIDQQPEIAARVPLIHIASYLGITPESLSRIRKNLA